MRFAADCRAAALRITAVVLVVAAALALAWKSGLFALEDRAALADAIARARGMPHLPVVFVIVYALAGAVGVPVTPFTLAGGALFGAPLGIALNLLGEALAAHLTFALVRATGFSVGGKRRTGSADIGSLGGSSGARALLRLRLIPVVPFSLLNVSAGASGMSWRAFATATVIGIIPVTVIYTISAAELVAGVAGSGARALVTALASATVLIGASFLPSVLRRVRSAK